MFQSLVISPDQEVGSRLGAALESTGNVAVAKTFSTYPTALELVRTLRAYGCEILFLSFESLPDALEIVRMFDEEATHVQIVGFHKNLDPGTLRESMRAGVREFLSEPFDEKTVMESLLNVKRLLEKHPVEYPATQQIFTFLPSKAGAGTSTIAANVSAALSRKPNTRVLLGDFDLSSGMLRFMLKLKNEFSVTDAVAHAMDMDEDLWAPLVTNLEGMDVLHAGHINPNLRLEPKHIRNLVGFMRRHYGVLCFDLSGNLEKYSLELMAESKHILLVCTPETASLHLAREKLAFLRHMDLAHRVSVVLTRLHKKAALSEREVEDLLGVSVIRVFPNDYHAVQQALDSGTLLPPASPLGKGFTDLADALVGQKSPVKAESYKRKFLEFVTPTA